MAGDFEPPSSAEVSRVQMHTIQQPKGHLPCTALQGRASWHHKLSCNSSPIVSSHINHKALTARCFTLAALTQHFVEHLQTPHTHSVLYVMVQHQGNGFVGQLLTHVTHRCIAVAHWMISESETKPLLKWTQPPDRLSACSLHSKVAHEYHCTSSANWAAITANLNSPPMVSIHL